MVSDFGSFDLNIEAVIGNCGGLQEVKVMVEENSVKHEKSPKVKLNHDPVFVFYKARLDIR